MTADAPTILATCGGLVPGEWTDAAYGPLVLHAIDLAGVAGRAPRVLHVNTAGGDPRFVEGQELEAARLAGVAASHLRLFPHPNVASVEEAVLGADVVWVSGGSVTNLLAVWRAHGVDDVMRRAWRAGVVLAGGSAGGLCWHSGGTTTSFGPAATVTTDGLAMLPGSFSPHDDSQPSRRAAFVAGIAYGDIPGGVAVEEEVGVLYRGTELVGAVSSRADGRAVAVARSPDGVTETDLPVTTV